MVSAGGVYAMLIANNLVQISSFVKWSRAVRQSRGSAPSQTTNLPELRANLVATLASLDVNNFSHGCCCASAGAEVTLDR